jgi:hypothetical protein
MGLAFLSGGWAKLCLLWMMPWSERLDRRVSLQPFQFRQRAVIYDVPGV